METSNSNPMYPPFEECMGAPYPYSPSMCGDMGMHMPMNSMPMSSMPMFGMVPAMPPMHHVPNMVPAHPPTTEEDCKDLDKMYYMHMYMSAMYKAEAYRRKMMCCDMHPHPHPHHDEEHC